VDQEQPQHEKIRFRRDEITDLGALPSACRVPPLGQASIGRGFRILSRVFAGVVALMLLAAMAVYLIGLSGIGSDRLRIEAETAIEKLQTEADDLQKKLDSQRKDYETYLQNTNVEDKQ